MKENSFKPDLRNSVREKQLPPQCTKLRRQAELARYAIQTLRYKAVILYKNINAVLQQMAKRDLEGIHLSSFSDIHHKRTINLATSFAKSSYLHENTSVSLMNFYKFMHSSFRRESPPSPQLGNNALSKTEKLEPYLYRISYASRRLRQPYRIYSILHAVMKNNSVRYDRPHSILRPFAVLTI